MANFYIPLESLSARFGALEVAKWSELGGDITLIIADACGEALAYLSSRYSLEQLGEQVPYEIQGAVSDLVRYRVYGDSASEELSKRAEQARQLLRDIGAGRAAVTLFDNPATPEDETATEAAVFTSNPRVFSRSEFSGW